MSVENVRNHSSVTASINHALNCCTNLFQSFFSGASNTGSTQTPLSKEEKINYGSLDNSVNSNDFTNLQLRFNSEESTQNAEPSTMSTTIDEEQDFEEFDGNEVKNCPETPTLQNTLLVGCDAPPQLSDDNFIVQLPEWLTNQYWGKIHSQHTFFERVFSFFDFIRRKDCVPCAIALAESLTTNQAMQPVQSSQGISVTQMSFAGVDGKKITPQ